LKVYMAFITPAIFALFSLISAVVAIALCLLGKHKDAGEFTFNSTIFLAISAGFYFTIIGLIELIKPELLTSDTVLFAIFSNNILIISAVLAVVTANLAHAISCIIKPSKKENKEIETAKSDK
jgi:hypothetical protein